MIVPFVHMKTVSKEIIISTFDIREGNSSDDIFSELLKASRRGVKVKSWSMDFMERFIRHMLSFQTICMMESQKLKNR